MLYCDGSGRCNEMANYCEICGKGTVTGMNVSHSHLKTKRTWKPNIQRVRAVVDGEVKRVYIKKDDSHGIIFFYCLNSVIIRFAMALAFSSIWGTERILPGSCAVSMRENCGGKRKFLLQFIAPKTCSATMSPPL